MENVNITKKYTYKEISKLTPDEVEYLFQKSNDKDTRYFCLQFCCENQCKKLLRGVHMPQERFDIRCGNAILECWEKIQVRGDKPQKLSSYTYWPCKRALWARDCIQEDKEMLSYEEHTENILAQENIGEIFYE